MKRTIIGLSLIALSLLFESTFHVIAGCGDTWQKYKDDTTSGSCGAYWGDVTFIDYTKHWTIFWIDGYKRDDAQAITVGQCYAGFLDNT